MSLGGSVRGITSSWRRPVPHAVGPGLFPRASSAIVQSGHGHQNEAVFSALAGLGHEVHDEQRHGWQKGDCVVVYINYFHRHNLDDEERARIAKDPTRNKFAVGDTLYVPSITMRKRFGAKGEPRMLFAGQNWIFTYLTGCRKMRSERATTWVCAPRLACCGPFCDSPLS